MSPLDLLRDERPHAVPEAVEASLASGRAVSVHVGLESVKSLASVVLMGSPRQSTLEVLLGGIELWRVWNRGARSLREHWVVKRDAQESRVVRLEMP